MKTLKLINSFFTMVLLVSLMASCSESMMLSGENEELIVPKNSKNITPSNARYEQHVTSGVVVGQSCGAPSYGHMYTVYASTNVIVNYERVVTITIYAGTSLLEQKVVIIPANSNVSNNESIFTHATESYGRVDIVTESVVGVNGQVNTATLRHTSPTVFNCYTPQQDNRDDLWGMDDDIAGGLN